MRTYALLFAWIPALLAFRPKTSSEVDYIFWTLLLLGLTIEWCAVLRERASLRSQAAIHVQYDLEYERAMAVNDFDAAAESIGAHRLFITRGRS